MRQLPCLKKISFIRNLLFLYIVIKGISHVRIKRKISLFKTRDDAVSQIVGTILLLMIVSAIFPSIYIYYLNYPLPDSGPYVNIVGTIENRELYFTNLGNFQERCSIVLTHRGGESLSLNWKVVIIIGNITEGITVGDCLDSESKDDGRWGIGERLIYPADDMARKKLGAIVVDPLDEVVLFEGILQEESMVATLGVFDVQQNGATLCMDYDFKEYGSGRVRFAYKKQSEENWEYTPWNPSSGMDFYHRRVEGLSSHTTYEYAGQLKYDDTVVTGRTKSFMTLN